MFGRGRPQQDDTRRHMWKLPSLSIALAAVPAALDSITSLSSTSFSKDGREISVGDCALFKPQQNSSPPFIGIIRWLTAEKESFLKLGVNWLYRPSDLKLSKGVWLEAAPNEVFYSFHKDEIPAASLLHPCKVAFLCKGVELPSGISSFVCRRVYDPSTKRLWWLTDQDYLNERQEEVDKLLYKTRLEMHAALQSEGRSPKSLNGPTPTPQLKPASDSAQSSPTSFPSQVKGKKRDRGERGSDVVKRERSSKTDDGNSGYVKPEIILKSEIAKITDKGGLVDYEGVEKLVQLMQPDRSEQKIDLAGRIMLAEVITVTDKYDCLGKFVQLRGLSILDEWLQEVHKGKIGDGGIGKESEKPIEEYLLALLRALDKLPVDLHALQTSNVGKSVNNLRSHKNLEIQKKARGLVDTWKKRVEAEMKMNDSKSGSSHIVSWPNRSGFPEVPHGGSRRIGGPTELPVKNSNLQPSTRTVAVKVAHSDAASKLMPASPGSTKFSSSLPASMAVSKDSTCKSPLLSGASDIPLTTVKEEKSSSSSQSQNNSQSCSSGRSKLLSSSFKEDARSSTAGSLNVNKTSITAAHHRKLGNAVLGSTVSGFQKDTTVSVKTSSMDRKSVPEKVHGLKAERADVSDVEHGSNHRLIVKIPNPGRSPAGSASGGSFDDHPVRVSQACSPDVNMEPWQSNDAKDGLRGSVEKERSASTLDDDHGKGINEDAKALETPISTHPSGGDLLSEANVGKSHEASLRSIKVLIESCVKFSEGNSSMAFGDDCGMNLLASVAAGETSQTEPVPRGGSPGSSSVVVDSSTNNAATKFLGEEVAVLKEDLLDDNVDGDTIKQVSVVHPSLVKEDEDHLVRHASSRFLEDSCNNSSTIDKKSTDSHSFCVQVSKVDLQRSATSCIRSDGKLDETGTTTLALSSTVEGQEGTGIDGANHVCDSKKAGITSCNADGVQDGQEKAKCLSSAADEKLPQDSVTKESDMVCTSVDVTNLGGKVEKEAVGKSLSCPHEERDNESMNLVHKPSSSGIVSESRVSPVMNSNATLSSCSGDALDPNNMDKVLDENVDCLDTKSQAEQGESQTMDWATTAPSSLDHRVAAALSSIDLDHENCVKDTSKRKEVLGGAAPTAIPSAETAKCLKGLKLSGIDENGLEDCVSTSEVPHLSVAAESDMDGKLDFDLNEGFPAEEGNQGDSVTSIVPESSLVVHLGGHLSLPLSSMFNGLPPSITVASAAKGPFVPPENLSKPSGEIGWRGSAATSAFRPAEPRKVLEMPLSAIDLSDIAASKHGRPPLDIDLNAPGDRVLEDIAVPSSAQMTGSEYGASSREFGRTYAFGSSTPFRNVGGLNLDLNKIEEESDTAQFSTSTNRRLEILSVRSSSSGGFPNGERNVLRNFDLNNGPGLDEVGTDSAPSRQHATSSVPFLPPVASIRMNNTELGSLSSWFPPGNSFSAAAIPSILPDRGEQPYPVVSAGGTQRILGSNGAISFGTGVYSGPVLSSSPALAFTPATAFPYPGFPFGSSFPLPSTTFSNGSTTHMDSSSGVGLCFPAVSSQLVGAARTVSSPYQRPYVISHPGGTTNGGIDSGRKWPRHGLDLNAGPGGTDIEGRDERLLSASRQLPFVNSQALSEEQVRMYQAAGASLKRDEPEGGWDTERYQYKHHSWQ